MQNVTRLNKIKTKLEDMVKEEQAVKTSELLDFDKHTKIDRENAKVMKRFVHQHELISISKFGKESSHNACLLVRHAPKKNLKFMRYYLNLMEENITDVNKKDFALLKDRVLTYEGKPQIYGSQLLLENNHTTWSFYPIQNVKEIDKLRAEVGLSLLSEYIKLFERMGDKVKTPEGYVKIGHILQYI